MIKIPFTCKEFLNQPSINKLNEMVIDRLQAFGVPAVIRKGLVAVSEGQLSVTHSVLSQKIIYQYRKPKKVSKQGQL